jgi:UDP-N-acetylglucosamine:LPS N-acetylglucosamine transferase
MMSPVRRGILIVSASMGAGHDGAAEELRRRLETRGHDVRVVDYLKLMPMGTGRLSRWTYEVQLKMMPWSYELFYKSLSVAGPLIWGPVVRLLTFLTRRPLRREFERTHPDVVVSVYPMASLVLGRMRKKRWLNVPVVTYLTDFAVHPLWVHPGIDLHLAVSPVSAATAAKRGGKTNIASGPLVADRFRGDAPDRDEVRRHMGIEPHEKAVLVVAGSWGVGDVPKTLDAITRAGSYHPITVCGRDDKLRASLLERGVGGTVLGWTNEMPSLMAASDALIENAGGLTAMEAFGAGLPVVTFHPIAGHGKANAQYMSGSGVSHYAHSETELASMLAEATTPGPERDALIERGKELFASDPADDVLHLASSTRAHALLTPFRRPRSRRRVTVAAASLAALYLGLTIVAQGVSALGVGVAKPPKDVTDTVYLGVRVDGDELRNNAVTYAVEQMGITVVVDARTARRTGAELGDLASLGVDIANGGMGKGRTLRWNRAHDDCDKAWKVIAARSGQNAREFVPGRGFDAFDQYYCHTGKDKQKLVRPNETFGPEELVSPESRKVYLLDGRDRDAAAVAIALSEFSDRLAAAGLHVRPLKDLH